MFFHFEAIFFAEQKNEEAKNAYGGILSNLTIISLPIGNQKDITQRALEALESSKTFYAEDTRVFKDLLKSYGISFQDKFIDSFHDQNQEKVKQIIEKIKNGIEVCLVSDAGSPIISDPAYPLMKALVEENIEVNTIPGVTSVVVALELSCLPPHPFHFWGFTGRSNGERTQFFDSLKNIKGTHIYFESPHRIYESIQNFFEIYPEQTLVVTRELTKHFQSVYRLKRTDLLKLEEIVIQKGEFVILFHNEEQKGEGAVSSKKLLELVEDYMNEGGSPKKLAKIFSQITGDDTKAIYDKISRK